jgi:UDP-glucose 4-epimerase
MIMNQHCLVVGGAGFIGSHIADALVQNGYPVRLFDLPRRKMTNVAHLLDRVEVAEGDFTNEADLERALRNVDYVFHLVGTTLPATSNENPIYDVESNLIGTLRLLQLARAAHIKKVIFISSGGTVYGIPETVPIPETHPTSPVCSYGITKLAIEKYLALFHHLYGLDYVILRASNPYGPRQQSIGAQQGVVSVFIDRIKRGEPITIWGDGSVVRDFVYIQDVAQAFVMALTSSSPHRIFNVGTGAGLSLNELLGLLAQATGITPRVNYLPGRSTDVPRNVLDTTRIRTEWGWSAPTPLSEGLARTWDWARQQNI